MFRDPCFVPVLGDLSAQSLLILTNCCFFFHDTVSLSLSGVSSSSPPNLTLLCSCLPMPYFRRSQGFNFYYVLMTHRCTPCLWRFVTQSSGCLPPRLFLFDFSISSHLIVQAPDGASYVLFIACLLKCCQLIGSFIPKPSMIFLIHLFYFMRLDDMQILCTLYCQYISPFLAHQTTFLMHVIRFYRCFTLKWLFWEILLLKSVDSAWF